jgi:hypothetical protein
VTRQELLRRFWPLVILVGVGFIVMGLIYGSGLGANGWFEPGFVIAVVGAVGGVRARSNKPQK